MDQPAPRKNDARIRLMQAASTLFYNYGMAATGIDAIIRRAGVAKKSLYNHFGSKEDLIAQYLQARHQEWLSLYHARIETAPESGVLAVFDAYLDHAAHAYENGFRGCGLLNAAAELPAHHAGRAMVRRHKEEVEAILLRHLGAKFAPEAAEKLAAHMALLLEGAMMRAGLEGTPERLHLARALALDLLAQAGEDQ